MSKPLPYILGADPEVFIQMNEELYPIVGLIGGNKEEPRIIDDFGQFALQEDNVAAEYNIPPSKTREDFIKHILWPQEVIANLLQAKNIKISKKASGVFKPEHLKSEQARTFGCDPDYNAWTKTINKKPEHSNPNFRSCGGHIHIGLPKKERKANRIIDIIRNMDHVVGVWSVIADDDTERRELYGKAGSFRFQPHGCEYRTLSNFWIFKENLIGEIWDRTQHALTLPPRDLKEAEVITRIINTGNKEDAKDYLRVNGLS